MKATGSLVLAAALAASVLVSDSPATAAPKQVTRVEGITEYALGNGMHVLLFPDSSTENVTVNVTYLVGSRMEGYGETGMAHLLEHMMFKGSPRHPKIWEEFKAKGASNNASTWYDRTNYFETLPAKGNNLAWALELEADRMVNANIAQKDLDHEFSVVRNEFEIGENRPAEILSERMWSTAYLWHNYGKSTIGSRADIERVPATSLKKFYKKYYRPDNAVLMLAGKFEPKSALRLIDRYFGRIRNPRAKIEPTYTLEPVQDGERSVTLRRSGDVQVVGLLYHVTATADPDYAAVDAIADLLTAEPSGRLYTALVKTGLATEVSASQLILHDPGVLEISATVPVGKSAKVVCDRMIRIIEGLGRSKITEAEVARFQAKEKKQFKLFFSNSSRLGVAVSEFIGAGDWRLLFWTRDRVEALTPATVKAAAAKYLVSSNRTLGMFYPSKAPKRAPLVETPSIAKVVGSYKGRAEAAAGETFVATLPNIEKRTQRSSFPNGMKLAVLAKQTRGHVVRAKLTMRYGTEADFRGKRLAASAIDEVIGRGTRKHTFQQLKDEWDKLEAQVRFSTEPGELSVDIQTTRDHLPAVLALVDEILHTATFPADQFEITRKESLAALDKQKSDPQAQAFTTVGRIVRAYPKNHPLYVPTTDEQIAELKRLRVEDVRQFARYFGMSNATMAIVGDVDANQIKGWLGGTWGKWKSPRRYQRIARKYTPTRSGEQVLDFPDKANALIAAVHAVPLKDDDADAPALTVANYALGGGGFVSRLLTRLRQKDGLSYFAFSAVQLQPLDRAGVFVAGGALNPKNAKKGMAAMIEEIQGMVSGGITAKELAGAKKGIAEGFERNLSNDGAILGMLDDGLYLGRTMDYWAKRNAAISKLSVRQVNAAIKKYIKPGDLVKITAGDKSKM